MKPWLILAAAGLGHCGFWLFCVNRVNATGLPRRLIKFLEKLCIALCILIPAVFLLVDGSAVYQWIRDGRSWCPYQTLFFHWYGAWCVASCLVLGVGWLESRLWLIPPRHLLRTIRHRHNVHRSLSSGSYASKDARWLGAIPGNQIGLIEVNQKILLLPRPLAAAEGLRIGHVSDLHFTGQLHPDHYRFVFMQLQELQPDLVLVTGDIIDFAHCLPWITDLFSSLRAPLGCGFVLGNHDRRLLDTEAIVGRLLELGWYDLGAADRLIPATDRNLSIQLYGNERPWFRRKRQASDVYKTLPGGNRWHDDESVLRIGVSHSPDQIQWARRIRCDLLFAGHTHGGQIRIPLVGPLVAPSWYGSKFASGVFYLPPTLMHVSRGVAGIHPLRFRCCPEVSLIVLTNHQRSEVSSS